VSFIFPFILSLLQTHMSLKLIKENLRLCDCTLTVTRNLYEAILFLACNSLGVMVSCVAFQVSFISKI
jgi:hypothetical protein